MARTGAVNRSNGQHHQTGSRHLDRSVPIRQRPLRRDHLERGQVLHLPRLRVAPATLQTRILRAVRTPFVKLRVAATPETVTEAAAIRVTYAQRSSELLSKGDRGRAATKREVLEASRNDEPRAVAARHRPPRRGARDARRGLRLVHRRLRHRRSQRREGAGRPTERIAGRSAHGLTSSVSGRFRLVELSFFPQPSIREIIA